MEKKKWKLPPKVKVHEAMGTISDERIKMEEDEIRVYSSSGNKFYTIEYDYEKNAIMSNDNASFWQGYLGYPSIAYLMYIGKITYKHKFADALKGIKWKDINQKFKNNWEMTEGLVNEIIAQEGLDIDEFIEDVDNVMKQIEMMNLSLLGKKRKPPKGY